MFLRFSYGKLVRPNGSTFTPSSAITTNINLASARFEPLGSTGAATAAPSTLIIDSDTGNQYTLSKAYSATNAALTAVTSSNDAVTLY